MIAKDQLFAFLRDRAHKLDGLRSVDTPDNPPAPIADQWVLASLLQKAVRRGELIWARRAAHQLLAIDRARLLRRLSIIALEDIGIADIEAVAVLVAIANLPEARRLLGGDAHALDIALKLACAAVKDRSGDHLISVLNHEPLNAEALAAISAASCADLALLIAAKDIDILPRLHAAARLAGIRSHGAVQLIAHPEIALRIFRDLGVPDLLLAACAVHAKHRDPLILVPLAWLLSNETGASDAVAEHRIISPLIGSLPAFSLDPLHTRLGKRAIHLWRGAHLPILGDSKVFSAPQLAMGQWITEAAICDRTLDWSLGNTLRIRADAAEIAATGLAPARHADLMAFIASEQSSLLAARLHVWYTATKTAATKEASPSTAERNSRSYLPLQVQLFKNDAQSTDHDDNLKHTDAGSSSADNPKTGA